MQNWQNNSMSKTYRVIVVGMGKRGMHHAQTFFTNKQFELAGICDIDQARLAAAAPKLGNPKTGTDAAKLAKESFDLLLAIMDRKAGERFRIVPVELRAGHTS